MTARNVRAYLQREHLPRSQFLGSATRYDRRQLLWLLALRRLRAADRLSLAEASARLRALADAELEVLATQGVAPGPLADALGLRPVASPGAGAATGSVASPAEVPRAPLPRWARLELALGLELHVRDDASPQTIELVRRVHALCAEQTAGQG
jgi:hypothetical protein